MESKKKVRKIVPPVQQSTSSSDEDSSSSSSDSSSDARRKQKHRGSRKQRDSSSSSGEEVVRKSHKHQHKKSSSSSSLRKHSHASKMRSKMLAANTKKELRSISPTSRAAHKHHLKAKLAKKSKQVEEHERRRDVIKESEHRLTSPTTRIRVSIPNNRVQERSRSIKDSPSTSSSSRRHVRETPDDHLRQKEKMRRIHEEEHYSKYMAKTPDKHHQHERSRSRSHGRVPIRDRLDKEYDYRRSISRERDYTTMIRGAPGSSRNEPVYEYRGGASGSVDERRIPPHDYSTSSGQSRIYEDRHHSRGAPSNWDDEHPRNRYEAGVGSSSRDWEHSHERKRDEVPHYKERQWPESSHRMEKEPKEWNRGVSGNWKEQGPPHPSSQMTPTMPHPRRWPGPSSSDTWSPRGPPHPSKMEGPPFKPRGSYFGFKRFPFKRFPNQYSKINYPSKRVLPSSSDTATATTTSTTAIAIETASPTDQTAKSNDENSQMDTLESGEIPSEMEEEKIAQQPDTTFSGTAEATEECEGNLSEFSDVDDDILNREEARTTAGQQKQQQKQVNESLENREQQQQDEQEQQDESAQKMISKIHANKELKKEMDLDFEEISDGELEEESKNKGFGDALGVDWASLARECSQKPATKSTIDIYSMTRSRWSAHRILWDIGVSVKYAGEEFARNILTEARNELRREKEDWVMKQKEQLNGDVKKEEVDIKKEPMDDDDNQNHENKPDDAQLEDFELDLDVLSHPLAQVQVLMRKLAIKRQSLIINSASKYGRALSARKDLKIRRKLCNLPTKDLLLDRSAPINSDVLKNVEEIYRRLVE